MSVEVELEGWGGWGKRRGRGGGREWGSRGEGGR